MYEAAMKDKLLALGVGGTIIGALCCFTPILVWTLTGLGLTAAVSHLDMVLIPTLLVFIIITGVALWRRRKSA